MLLQPSDVLSKGEEPASAVLEPLPEGHEADSADNKAALIPHEDSAAVEDGFTSTMPPSQLDSGVTNPKDSNGVPKLDPKAEAFRINSDVTDAEIHCTVSQALDSQTGSRPSSPVNEASRDANKGELVTSA